MSKRKYVIYSAKNPRPEKLSKRKHYGIVNACPECLNDNSDLIVKLRAGFYHCEKCGTEFSTFEI